MSTILGKRKSSATAGPDSGQECDAFPGAFPAMQPAAAADTGETDDESQDEEGEEDTNQMSLADGQFEAELPARMQRFFDDELEVLRVRARMRLRPGRAFADCARVCHRTRPPIRTSPATTFPLRGFDAS